MRIVMRHVEDAGGDPRVAGIALVDAFFEHQHAAAKLGGAVGRGQPRDAAADDGEIGFHVHASSIRHFGSSISMTSFTSST